MGDSPTDNSTDEHEEDTEDEDEDDEEDEDEDDEDEDEEEEDVSKKTKKHKIRQWDVLVNIAAENLQDTVNETVVETLAGHQNKDIQEASTAYIPLQVYGWGDSCIKERSSPPENNENS